ncbi:pyruvate kinase [Chloroherpeton thalassium ATCC 35110]|uniref:Pyruvate kinase n=1 Tax=Chloroherpeton thalassium (strain ATCC 35110 / GB-78) TaxID=517418 RepID=B3QUG4_CHLT3|nr:pyruvate kinase [Chloroherpeton thalassium]ACF14413.1 pyruvate kinase [Chloroherpeton thalassium ATCC 35110]
MKRTKIICTLGPSTDSIEKIVDLINEGMDVARLNFSHGTREEQEQRIQLVRKASELTGKAVAILQDLQGPKIRIGDLAKTVLLNQGEQLRISTEEQLGNYEVVSTSYKEIVNDVNPGDTILMDDGRIELKVISKTATEVVTEIVIGGLLKPKKGLNLPGVNISIPSLTEKDLEDLDFGLAHDVDMVALSFVRSANDVKRIKQLIHEKNKDVWAIAKIEKPEAVANIDAIILESDGVMVARGDLGIEMRTEEVPVLQKMIVEKCSLAHKPVIIATQMLESMIENPRPTRAEANDVANAVFDGTDAVMLSGETAAGNFPVEAVRTMREIIERVEKQGLTHIPVRQKQWMQACSPRIRCIDLDEAIAASAVQIAESLLAKAIIVLTHSGATAVKISKQKPKCAVIAVSDKEEVQRWMCMVWGINTIVTETMVSTDESFRKIEKILRENGVVKTGDLVVYTLGIPILDHGGTDTIKVSHVN